MNYWQMQAERNAAIDRGVPVSVPGFSGWVFYVRPKHAWNYHFARAAARIAAADVSVIQYFDRVAAPAYVPTADDQALGEQIERRAFAEGCLAGWSGVEAEDGSEMPFSLENAHRLLEFFPQIYSALLAASTDITRFKPLSDALKLELAAGNSKAGCDSSLASGGTISAPLQPAETTGEKARRKK